MRPAEVIRRASDYLERHSVESPRATAEILMSNVLGTDRAGLYVRSDGLTSAEARAFGRALCRRCAGTPLQHLTGEQPFRGITLSVRPGVFVPRPETEVVVEIALSMLIGSSAPAVADVGTGTGAIALALAAELSIARVVATDLSAEAVALARENADRLNLRIEVVEGDGLAPLPAELRGALDLVVSNPPYVDPDEHGDLPPEVRADPQLALVGGPEVHGRIAREAASWLRPDGGIVLEIGAEQAEAVGHELVSAGYRDVRVERDLAGRDRVATGRRR